jgi:hypothetical protein
MVHQRILFTEDECDYLINYRNNGVYRNGGGYENRIDINYKQWTISRNDDLEFLFHRVINFIEEKFNVKITNFNEDAWIYQYEVNDGYSMHTDNILNRRFTIGIQLNNKYEGGDLMVDYNGKRIIVNKEIGNCYIFESFLLHGVSPIISGNRYNFLTFMHNYNLKTNKMSLI